MQTSFALYRARQKKQTNGHALYFLVVFIVAMQNNSICRIMTNKAIFLLDNRGQNDDFKQDKTKMLMQYLLPTSSFTRKYFKNINKIHTQHNPYEATHNCNLSNAVLVVHQHVSLMLKSAI